MWLINIVAIKAKEGIDHCLTTDQGDHRVQNGTPIALVNPDLTDDDRKRLNDLMNSGAFIAAFIPKREVDSYREVRDRLKGGTDGL